MILSLSINYDTYLHLLVSRSSKQAVNTWNRAAVSVIDYLRNLITIIWLMSCTLNESARALQPADHQQQVRICLRSGCVASVRFMPVDWTERQLRNDDESRHAWLTVILFRTLPDQPARAYVSLLQSERIRDDRLSCKYIRSRPGSHLLNRDYIDVLKHFRGSLSARNNDQRRAFVEREKEEVSRKRIGRGMYLCYRSPISLTRVPRKQCFSTVLDSC